MWTVLDSRWVSRAGNLAFILGAVQSGTRLLLGLSLNVVGVTLFMVGIALMIGPRLSRERTSRKYVSPLPMDRAGEQAQRTESQEQRDRLYGGAAIGEAIRRASDQDETQAVLFAAEAELALAYEEALEMAKILRQEWRI